MSKKITRVIPIIFLLLILVTTVYYLNWVARDDGETISTAGTVEVVEVVITTEIGGRIAEVLADEGDQVNRGDILVRFEDAMLQAQYDQAKATLAQAQANYALIAAQPLVEQRQVAISIAQLEYLSAQQALKELIENSNLVRALLQQELDNAEDALEDLLDPDLQQAVALESIAIAQKAVDEAEKRVRNLKNTASQADINAAEADVVLARDALDKAKDDYKPYEDKPDDNLTRANFQARLAAAQQVYDAVVRRFNALSGTGSEIDIAVAEADLQTAVAELKLAQREFQRIKDGSNPADIAVLTASIEKAMLDLSALKEGPDPDDLALAEARVHSTEANQDLASANTIQEQLDVAQAQVDSAQAALGILQAQLDKLTLAAPIDGVVLFRTIEPGESVKPGSTAITLGLLDQLTITVYVPEDRYGGISLGNLAAVNIDAFPGVSFTATVIRIADQAEYTPRNVQTAEGRRTTVFAIELSVEDPDRKLKPGMPADVIFSYLATTDR